jgi:hypothetical protein
MGIGRELEMDGNTRPLRRRRTGAADSDVDAASATTGTGTGPGDHDADGDGGVPVSFSFSIGPMGIRFGPSSGGMMVEDAEDGDDDGHTHTHGYDEDEFDPELEAALEASRRDMEASSSAAAAAPAPAPAAAAAAASSSAARAAGAMAAAEEEAEAEALAQAQLASLRTMTLTELREECGRHGIAPTPIVLSAAASSASSSSSSSQDHDALVSALAEKLGISARLQSSHVPLSSPPLLDTRATLAPAPAGTVTTNTGSATTARMVPGAAAGDGSWSGLPAGVGVPTEPPLSEPEMSVFTLKLRLPDGTVLVRRFGARDTLGGVAAFVVSTPARAALFGVHTDGSPKLLFRDVAVSVASPSSAAAASASPAGSGSSSVFERDSWHLKLGDTGIARRAQLLVEGQ